MTKTPIHLWIVGILSLLWNAVGGFDYVMTQTQNAEYIAAHSDAQRGFLTGAPAWFEAAWATGVWLSIAGSLLLLFKSKWAGTAFGISLIGLIIASVYTYVLADGGNAMAVSGTLAVVFTFAIPVILILLLIYARVMTRQGVLR